MKAQGVWISSDLVRNNKEESMKTFSTDKEKDYMQEMEQHLQHLKKSNPLSYLVNNFAKYVRRQELTRFLVRHELYKKILNIKGF